MRFSISRLFLLVAFAALAFWLYAAVYRAGRNTGMDFVLGIDRLDCVPIALARPTLTSSNCRRWDDDDGRHVDDARGCNQRPCRPD